MDSPLKIIIYSVNISFSICTIPKRIIASSLFLLLLSFKITVWHIFSHKKYAKFKKRKSFLNSSENYYGTFFLQNLCHEVLYISFIKILYKNANN